MDQLISQVADRIGVSQDKAREAVEMVLKFMKEKLPSPASDQIEQFLKVGDDASGAAGDVANQVMKGLGGMFGK